MHEAAIAQSIIDIVLRRLASIRSDNAKAQRVSVILGEFRNVEPESLAFAFENMREFYPELTECRLDMETISAQAKCQKAQHLYHPEPGSFYLCPICESGIGCLIRGEEMDVVNVVIEIPKAEEEKRHARIG